ncbi:MAG: RIP metalloprotease RseP [Rhodospirillaceae bacterium]|nr:RIP metalloprotease RseP [Rhodospirillaceae bacterium]MBT5299084.1 RIP metalloprotease RseP [Rhodospirillaceae bacterium]MBT5513982.1 RIP metalloprotease RseP [Rhodospirillaceae bacterium]MBT6608362.1 RIP metalloprotease RseP [Rhodospirillaceae bacterium]MBT7248837.1 RIP metalloprotease RseP [Rhodospirillaceae bacterium]
MNFFDFTWNYIIVFLIVLTVLIYVHEWGHYWVALRNGVRVEVFSIGFGPEVFGWTNKVGTRWKIGLIPLGGYVKMFGEDDGASSDDDEDNRELTPEEKEVSFHHKTLGQRAAIVAAGPIVNFIFAIFAFAGLAMFEGNPIPLAYVGEVMPKSAAAEAGLIKGDQVVAIEGTEITTFEELRQIVIKKPEQKLMFDIRRDGKFIRLPATPRSASDGSGTAPSVGRLGIRPHLDHLEFERQDPITAIWVGVERTAILTYRILTYIGDMITGDRSTDDLGGPLRIAKISGEMAQLGLSQVILLMAMLSVNLGLINLFPIPMLDGGHLAFYAAEAVRGRPLGQTAQEYGFRFGLILVLLLVVFVTWNDLVHLRVIEFLKELFV